MPFEGKLGSGLGVVEDVLVEGPDGRNLRREGPTKLLGSNIGGLCIRNDGFSFNPSSFEDNWPKSTREDLVDVGPMELGVRA